MSGALLDDLPVGREEEAADWCVRLGEGALAADEQAAFDDWLAAPGNREALEEAVLAWQGTEAAAETPELIHIRSAALDSFRRANRRRWSSRMRGHWYWPASAAAAILLLVAAGFLLLRVPVQVFETAIGEREVAMLEDGSRLSLDGASRIEARLSNDRRELRLLSGRARFDVARDPLRPFSVAAGNRLVVATGTSFSVELVGGQVRVVLYEGKVEILDAGAGAGSRRTIDTAPAAGSSPHARALTPGHELVASLSGDAARIIPTDSVRSLSWEAGQLSFEDEPLALAVERMNRYASTPLDVADRAAASVRVSGVFTAGDTEAFVEGVTALHDVRASRGNGRVTLSRR